MNFSTASSPRSNDISKRPLIAAFALLFVGFWAVSFAGTTDLSNWWVENLLVILFSAALVLTFRRFAFSNLSYTFIFLFMILHVYGAKYAYADNPLGFYLQQQFGTARNPYDRIVHTSFGLLMAYPMRELLMRRMKASERWSWILPIELVLSLSGLFELIEWSIADVFFPKLGPAYVGTQGDVWDAQKDMFMATCGAAVVMVVARMVKEVLVIARARRLKAIAA